MSARELPIPPHFSAARVGQVWRVPYQERAREAEAWATRHRIGPAAGDETRICLVAVDCQNTFCLPEFELFVGGRSGMGAVEDNRRLCRFVYRNLGRITEIVATLDTHTALQIFHPLFWIDDKGEHPEGGKAILALEDVEAGAWGVNPEVAPSLGGDLDYLERYARHYVRVLSEGGKYPLLVWPYHAMLGGIGHALVSALEEAFFFHGIARRTQTRFEMKGDNPLTENYSVLHPEVMSGPDGEAIAERNTALTDRLLGFDAILIAGQAQSHCVAWTVHDLLTEIEERDPSLAAKVYLLEDCTSPVVVPGAVDFTEQAEEAFARFSGTGMHLVRSTDPMADWPGFER